MSAASTGRVAVLLGGTSAERDVSLSTGRAVLEALRGKGVEAEGVDTAGDWRSEVARLRVGAVFIALHGRGGEDGTIQGALDLMGIPYTGPGVLGSALAMDKILSKRVFEACGIPTPAFVALDPGQRPGRLPFEYPVVVKPSREGSTIGVTVVRNAGDLSAAVDLAASHDPFVLIESFAPGDDLTVGVLNGKALAAVQIVTETGFYDYHTKYVTGAKEYRAPAPISPEATEAIRGMALAAAGVLRCCGGVRVDFRGSGEDFTVLEVNTVPGMTPTSLLPKSAAAHGIDFPTLVMEMLRTAGEGSR